VTTHTFRMSANGPVALTIEAETVTDAYLEANRTLVPAIPGFYAWMGDSTDFYATCGAWD
jgi:hypothetical protein